MERLKQLYSEYDFDFTDEGVKSEVERILAEGVVRYDTMDVYKECLGMIDLTSLNVTDTDDRIGGMMERVNEMHEHYKGVPNVAAVCVYPALVPTAKATLEAEGVRIAAVAAGFPAAQTFVEAKVAEVALTVAEGAEEVDVVMSVGKFLSGFHSEVMDELREIKDACHGARLKVILETGVLPSVAAIKQASLTAIAGGADFIKTSTGKCEQGATLEAVYVMCQTVREYYEKTGERIGIKVAGGVVTTRQAVEYYTVVRTVLGEEWMEAGLLRFGASRLANNLLGSITGKEEKYF